MADTLLAVVEMGGYPNFTPLYQRMGYAPELVNSVRKGQAWLKNNKPAVVVAEFNFDPEFRDRMSNLESLLATLQRYECDARVIVLIEKDHMPRLDKVTQRYSIFQALRFPVSEQDMQAALAKAALA